MNKIAVLPFDIPDIEEDQSDLVPKSRTTRLKNQQKQTKISSELVLDIASKIPKKFGIFTSKQLAAAGFEYTGDADTAICKQCKLEVSNWTTDMKPIKIHLEQKPDCPFVVRSKPVSLFNETVNSSTLSISIRSNTTSPDDNQEGSSKRIKVESNDFDFSSNTLFEVDSLRQVRRRGFSHWPHKTTSFTEKMIDAGFFNCNVGDRVICLYCNLMCQQWNPHTDDPCEVHKTLSPNCIYVKAKLIRPQVSSISIVNETSAGVTSNNQTQDATNCDPLRSNEIVFPTACNTSYAELLKRHASFSTWPNENLPSVDDFVRAGFFYTGTKTIVTCFYCNGSLHNWSATDNPMIEHARWFPHCAYARHLCGDEMYRKIQESKRAQQERARANEMRNGTSSINSNMTTNGRQLLIPDESTLSRLVAARLDLPISRRLLDKYFKLSLIKRCWKDQLRLKKDDFGSHYDLYVACLILQKQIEHIDGKKENIVIPSIRMKQIREKNGTSTNKDKPTSNLSSTQEESIQCNDEIRHANMTPSDETLPLISQPLMNSNLIRNVTTNSERDQSPTTLSNLCMSCLTDEKRLVYIPCGHLATCILCGLSLQSCLICRNSIEKFLKINI